MIDRVNVYFRIGGFTYQQNFKEIPQAKRFIARLEGPGIEDREQLKKRGS